MDVRRVIKVFLASPMDLTEEREIFMKNLEKINETLGQQLHLQYQVVSWERDVIPDIGDDAQDVVNAQIEMDYDVFVAIFRNRIGTPTKRAISGTVEEYQRALAYRCSNPRLRFELYFFKNREDSPEIGALKERVKQDGVLFMEPDSKDSFELMVYRHFAKLMMDNFKKKVNEKDPRSLRRHDVAVAAALVTPDKRLLLVQRSDACKFGPYMWQLPGGKVEPEEKPVDALIREIREELSITLDPEALKQLQVFKSFFLNDKTRSLDMHLFLCPVEEMPEVRLNSENQCYEWIDIQSPSLFGKELLGLHQTMIQVVWQELGAFSVIDALLEWCGQSDTMVLPSRLPNTSVDQIHDLYTMLATLGFVTLDKVPRFTSAFSKKLLDALLRMSRSGTRLFDDGKEDPAASLKMLPGDFELLRQHREKTLYSHQSLLAMMSCKASLPNSTRHVSNVLVFGENRGNLYILMRWDFFSQKFQMLGTGIRDAGELTPEQMAERTLSRRFDEMAPRLFRYLPIKEYVTNHFAAGSVDGNPIMRRYIIHPVAATVRMDCREDFLETVRRANELTQLALEYSFAVSRDQKKRLRCFCWCRADELMKERNRYCGHPVRGFEETLSHIGHSDLMIYAQNPVALEDEDVCDVLTPLLRKYHL